MKPKGTSDTIVGLFVLLSFVLLIFGTFIVRGNMVGSSLTIFATFNSVSGLEVGSPVLVAGVRKGRVAGITYKEVVRPANAAANGGGERSAWDQPVVVRIVVSKSIPIYSNARVKLVQQGFIGDKRVEIDPGSAAGGKAIAEGHYFNGDPYFDIERVFKQAEAVVDDLQATVSSFKKFVTDDENVRALRETITNLNQSVIKARDYLETNEENVAETVANLREVTDNLRGFSRRASELLAEGGRVDKITSDSEATVAELRKQFADLTGKAHETIDSVNNAITNIDARSEKLTESAVGFMDATKEDIGSLSDSLRETSGNLDAVIVKIRRGEGTVGRLVSDPQPFEDLKASIESLRNFLTGRQERFYDTSIPYGTRPAPAVPVPSGTPDG